MSEPEPDLNEAIKRLRAGEHALIDQHPGRPTPGAPGPAAPIEPNLPPPTAKDNRNLALIGLFLVAVCGLLVWGAISLVGGLFHSAASAINSATAPVSLAQMNPDLVRIKCERAVRERLRAPDTASFNGGGTPTFVSPDWLYGNTVTAENALAVPLKTAFTCVVSGVTDTDAVAVATLSP